MTNLALVFPEIFLSLSIMFLLILGVFKKNSSKLIQNISLIILLITSVITLNETLGIQETLLFNSSVPPKDIECPLKYVNEASVDAFHDKELSLVGISWLQKKIQEHNNKEFKLLSEIC